MDELFYTPHQSAEWVSAQTRPAISPQQLFQYSERGSLPICFRYRGNLGVYENPRGIIDGAIGAHDLFPVEQRHVYFDGYLRSLSPCQLQVRFKKILPKPAEWTEDILKPRAVDVAGAPVHCHPPLPDLPAGCYLGRAREDGGLDTGNVQNTQWLYAASDLAGLVSLIAPRDTKGLSQSAPALRPKYDGDRLQQAVIAAIRVFNEEHGRLPLPAEIYKVFAEAEDKIDGHIWLDPDEFLQWEDWNGVKRRLAKDKFKARIRRYLSS